MKPRNVALAILSATVWISLSEFVRNQYLVRSFWVQHYQGLGLQFPSDPVNGAVWGLWSVVFAVVIFLLSRKFSLIQTVALSWVIGFLMMWLVIGNLGVLPFGILPYAIPLSLLEAFLATLIIRALAPR
jgi:hypothetical protein